MAEPREAGTSTTQRRVVRLIGWAVVAVSLAFLAYRITISRVWTLDTIAIGPAVLVTVGGAVAYGIACLLLSTAWRDWLHWAGEPNATMSRCHGIYGRTQIAKYLPGNVFHFAGRHVVGRGAGFGHQPMVAAAVMEVLALVSAATVLAVAGLGWFGMQQAAANFSPWLGAATVAVLVAAPLLAAVAVRRLPTGGDRRRFRLRRLLRPYGLTLLFMAVAGGLFLFVARFGAPQPSDVPATLVVGTFAFAWLIGFLVPGASGGIGVREAAIVLVLTPQFGEGPAIVASVLMRLVTLGGDLLFFAVAQMFPTGPEQ